MNPTHFRYFDAPATDSGVEASLASDVPYARSGYTEVLVCTPDAVDLSRAQMAGALSEHFGDREDDDDA